MIDSEYDHATDSIQSGLYVPFPHPDHLLERAEEVRVFSTRQAFQVLLRALARRPRLCLLRQEVQYSL